MNYWLRLQQVLILSTAAASGAATTSFTRTETVTQRSLPYQSQNSEEASQLSHQDYRTFAVSTSGGQDFVSVSVCEPDIDADFIEQRISFEYTLHVNQDVNPLVKIQEVEERMHSAISSFFLKCENVDTHLYYVRSILTYPPDELMGECGQEGDDSTTNTVAGTACYNAKSHLTAEIVYRDQRRLLQQRTMEKQRGLAEEDVADADSFGDALSDIGEAISHTPTDENSPPDSSVGSESDSLSDSSFSDIISDPEINQYLTESTLNEVLEGESVSKFLEDPDLVSSFGSFFTDLFADGSLLDDELVALSFNGFLNGGSQQTGDVWTTTATPAPRSYRTFAGATAQEQPTDGDTPIMPFILVGLAALILIMALIFVVRQKRKVKRNRLEGAQAKVIETSSEKGDDFGADAPNTLEETQSVASSVLDDDGIDVAADNVFVLSDLRDLELSLQWDGFEVEVMEYVEPEGTTVEHRDDGTPPLSHKNTVNTVRIAPCRPTTSQGSLYADECEVYINPNTVTM